jgi:hypothetical protein
MPDRTASYTFLKVYIVCVPMQSLVLSNDTESLFANCYISSHLEVLDAMANVCRSPDIDPRTGLKARETDGSEKPSLCLRQDGISLQNSEDSCNARRKTGSVITIIGSALANFSDGYQQNLASSTNVIFNHLLGKEVYTSSRQTRISNALLIGSVIGILIFGYTSDRFSRKGGMLVTSALVAVGSLMATLVFEVNGAAQMLWFLTIARGASGVGVGGLSLGVLGLGKILTYRRRVSDLRSRSSGRLERAFRLETRAHPGSRLNSHSHFRRSDLYPCLLAESDR